MKHLLLTILTLALFTVIGCGDDDSAPTAGTGGQGTIYSFDSYRQWIDMIAPSVYTAPVKAPSGGIDPDSMWTDGEYPLLGKVFGENEPMSLYTNVEYLDEIVARLNIMLGNGDSTSYILDTSWVTLLEINGAQELPSSVVGVMGFSSVTLDRALLIDNPDGDTVHVGFRLTDSTQTVLAYHKYPFEGGWDSFLFYGHVNSTDSTVDIRGTFYKQGADLLSHAWVYDIRTVNESDFAYRMSWYAEDSVIGSLLGCIIGGGNKADQFAMKYRQYMPADTSDVDDFYQLDQMFDSQYNYLGDIAAGYESYVDINDLFLYGDVPMHFVPSPWQVR